MEVLSDITEKPAALLNSNTYYLLCRLRYAQYGQLIAGVANQTMQKKMPSRKLPEENNSHLLPFS